MEKIKDGMLYISADGDGIGKLVGRAILANDVEELHSVSGRIDAAQDFILHWCKQVGGIKISGGGDEFVAAINPEAKDEIKNLRASIEKAFGYTISVGIGRNLSESGTALLVAKLRGKDRIVYFNKHIKDDIRKAKRRVREGRASQEEYKLSEAYLEKSENMLCQLHKSDEHQTPKPHASHEDMMKIPKSAHEEKRDFHGNMKAKYAAGISPSLQESHRKMAEMHANYVAATGAMGPAHKKKHEERAKALHSELSKSDLRKHEEGFHDPKTNDGSSDPCPYCADNEDNRTDDCQYCQDLDAQENADGTAGMHDCPMCQNYDASKQNTGGIDGCPYCQDSALDNSNPDDCEMCKEYNAAQGTKDLENITEVQANPDQTNLAVEDMGAQHPDNCPECNEMYSDAVENQPDQTGQGDPNLQGHETAEEVIQALDQEPGTDGQTPAEKAKKIDNTELPQGDAMKDNASVTENFGNAQRKDVSDSEKDMSQSGQDDSPNMSEVLQGGLDEHANEQKRQEVVSMVAQTLQGFKANKASLEATKDQNQGLYNSCIQMLKSMIELCKLLGLEPAMPAQAPNDPGAVAEATQSDAPNGPKQAAPSEGAAQDPKTQS